MRLTDAGRALVAHADVILARLADAERELAAIAGLRGGRVRLASFPSAGATLVTEAVSLYQQRHPEVELSLTEGEPHDDRARAEARRLRPRGRVRVLRQPAAAELLDGTRLHPPARRPAAASSCPRTIRSRRRKAIRLEQLADEPWVGGCGGGVCNAMLVDACAEAGFKPNVAFESDDHNVLVGLVAAGVGVTLLPELALRTPHPGRRDPRRLRVAIRAQIYAAMPADAYRSPATEAMIEVLSTVSERFASRLPGRRGLIS